jgi:hypothetical protein
VQLKPVSMLDIGDRPVVNELRTCCTCRGGLWETSFPHIWSDRGQQRRSLHQFRIWHMYVLTPARDKAFPPRAFGSLIGIYVCLYTLAQRIMLQLPMPQLYAMHLDTISYTLHTSIPPARILLLLPPDNHFLTTLGLSFSCGRQLRQCCE